MKPDQYLSITGYDEWTERQLIGNSYIAIKINHDFCNKTLLFSQKTLQFIKAIDYRHLEPLTNCEGNIQYFGASLFDEYLETILIFEGDEEPKAIPIEVIYDTIKEDPEATRPNSSEQIFTEEYNNLLDNWLIQIAVQMKGQKVEEDEISIIEIEEVEKEVSLSERLEFLGNYTYNNENGIDKTDTACYKMRFCVEEDGKAKDLKVFYTQDFLVIVTLYDIFWKHSEELRDNKKEFWKINFDNFDPRIRDQGF